MWHERGSVKASELKEMANERLELAKALIRASEKAKNPAPKRAAAKAAA